MGTLSFPSPYLVNVVNIEDAKSVLLMQAWSRAVTHGTRSTDSEGLELRPLRMKRLRCNQNFPSGPLPFAGVRKESWVLAGPSLSAV